MKTFGPTFAPIRSLVVTIAGVLTAVVAVAVGRRLGVLEPELAKRLGVLVFGIMLAVLGNYLPKFALPLTTPAAAGARRLAGWVFVVAGVAYVATCLLAPMPQAVIASSVIGVGAFVLAGANWLRVARHVPHAPATDRDEADETKSSVALVVYRAGPHILLGLFFVFVIFLTDALWGDAVARWMAIGYPIAVGVTIPFLVVAGRVRRSWP